MRELRIGVVGVGRGSSLIKYGRKAENARLVAVCDNWEEALWAKKKELNDSEIGFYTDYDEFLNHDMDAVILANFANQHVPFAIKAMEKGKHVISEVLPCQNLSEAVALIETIERTGMKYAYLENTCYMPGPREMKRLYRQGVLGELEYGEGEYCHNCQSLWPDLTRGGDPEHWRNMMFPSFYCTHSMGPLVHVTGLRPVSVTGFELANVPRMRRMGRRQGVAVVEMVTLENGAIVKSVHGELYQHSIWFSMYGAKGRMETAREDAEMGHAARLYLNVDKEAEVYDVESNHVQVSYLPKDEMSVKAKGFGHLGSDFYCTWNAVEYILGNPDADPITAYEALDMFLPGLFAHFSILDGGVPKEIPNLRDPAEREKYRHDTRCTDPAVAGDMLLPVTSHPSEPIPQETRDKLRAVWEAAHS